MNRRVFGTLIAPCLVLAIASCKEDPLSDFDGNPAGVVTNFTALQLAIGEEEAVTARIVDGRATPLPVPITFRACTPDVSVAPDPSYDPVPETSARAIVTAVSANPTCVEVSGGGVSDSVSVAVLPQAIAATLSSTNPQAGDTITIGATAVLKFDLDEVAVTFPGGNPATILAKTADQLTVLVPFSDAGPITIAGIDVTYVEDLIVTLPTTTNVTQTGSLRPASGSYQTAVVVSDLIPAAAGQTSQAIIALPTGNSAVCPEVVMGFGSAGPCAIYRFTLAAPTQLRFQVDWIGTAAAPDVDLLVCSDTTLANFNGNTGAPCGVAGFGAATGAKPQITAPTTIPAGTYWLVIENFDGTVSRNHYLAVIRP